MFLLRLLRPSTLIAFLFSCPDIYKDDILQKDMSWIRAVHPNGYTVERSVRHIHRLYPCSIHVSGSDCHDIVGYRWMRENNYRGEFKGVLKRKEDAKGPMFNPEKLTAI